MLIHLLNTLNCKDIENEYKAVAVNDSSEDRSEIKELMEGMTDKKNNNKHNQFPHKKLSSNLYSDIEEDYKFDRCENAKELKNRLNRPRKYKKLQITPELERVFNKFTPSRYNEAYELFLRRKFTCENRKLSKAVENKIAILNHKEADSSKARKVDLENEELPPSYQRRLPSTGTYHK